jgi:aerobic carbon-monoxide dehydrogenase medium subunit
MRKFDVFEPESLEEASTLAMKWAEKGVIHAGGTDVIVAIKNGKLTPGALISLRRIPGLSYIRKDENVVKVGACTTIRTLEKSYLIRERFPALAEAVDSFASVQIRNIATIGGNICNGMPSADTLPPLLVYDALLGIYGPTGHRTTAICDFLTGPGKTTLAAGEILEEIVIALPEKGTESAYSKLTRRSSMELSLIAAATRIKFDHEGTISHGSIALSCAGPVCFRARNAEILLSGKRIDDTLAREVGEAALLESNPRGSNRCTREYREKMIPVLIAANLRRCHEQCEKRTEAKDGLHIRTTTTDVDSE